MLNASTLILILLFSLFVSAKEHKPEDYPLKVTVQHVNYHAQADDLSFRKNCDMVIASESTVWSIDSKDWHCRQFPPGSVLFARLRDLLGQHFIYLAWLEKDKLREAYWVILSATQVGNGTDTPRLATPHPKSDEAKPANAIPNQDDQASRDKIAHQVSTENGQARAEGHILVWTIPLPTGMTPEEFAVLFKKKIVDNEATLEGLQPYGFTHVGLETGDKSFVWPFD